jgi:hypothetical protein
LTPFEKWRYKLFKHLYKKGRNGEEIQESRWRGEERAKALKKHLIEHIPASTVCDELGGST